MTARQNDTPIMERLMALRDEKNAAFVSRLVPTVAPETILGARTPALRTLARQLVREGRGGELTASLPHCYFEEYALHAFVLCGMKDFDACLAGVERLLPYVDNWATCDSLSPQCFARHLDRLKPAVDRWLRSEHEYTVRFGIGMLMRHFLDDAFCPQQLEQVACIRREEYYIRMMQAWYFATALAKQYDATLPLLEQRRLERWTHNKTIQKAMESYRIDDAQKEHLKSLRWRSVATKNND